ncbi:hypothetical protein Syun_025692 [Stephania yunnanensis]|uniref:Uncharacterized protein n=1 Tax=Stephania yunnanensis TaxID=152371 RepID=A0AAP0EV25_9MAGN
MESEIANRRDAAALGRFRRKRTSNAAVNDKLDSNGFVREEEKKEKGNREIHC